jgi:Vam6/Vps39-like protein vacuolar protein sorting-associated protein 39
MTRRTRIRALNAVSEFRASKFDSAIDTFLELDLNPAKVIALYPESVAGRLSVPQEGWIPLFGGPAPTTSDDASVSSDKGSQEQTSSPAVVLDALIAPAESIRSRLGRTGLGLGVFLPSSASATKEPDTASLSGKPPQRGLHGMLHILVITPWVLKYKDADDLHRSVETLVRYLTDPRPKLTPALAAVHITPENQSDVFAPLSEIAVEELFALPNLPLSSLTPEQLLRYAQIIDTALYKSYLIIRPGLLGPLCRTANWCEVSEVEEDLHARQVFIHIVGAGRWNPH